MPAGGVRHSVVHVTNTPSAQPPSVVWQTRLSGETAALYERDIEVLGLDRSEALRRGLRLLHREALEVQMARDVQDFYEGARAPLSGVTAAAYDVAPTEVEPTDGRPATGQRQDREI